MNNTPNLPRIQQWIEALESGEFTQGVGMLAYQDHNGDIRYCCLGVVSELCIRAEGLDEKHLEPARNPWSTDSYAYFGERFGFTEEVAEWLGLSPEQHDLEVVIDGKRGSVIAHNDIGRTFTEIAAALREYFNLPRTT